MEPLRREESERLFRILDALSPSTSAYQRMCAPRELPLVVLREVGAERSPDRA